MYAYGDNVQDSDYHGRRLPGGKGLYQCECVGRSPFSD